MAYVTVASAQYDTYGGGGVGVGTVREDLRDMILIMTPRDIPMFGLLSQISTTNRRFDWVTDELTRPTVAGAGAAAVEGEDTTFSGTVTYRPRLSNFVRITKKMFDVTGSQRAVDEAGVTDEYTHQAWKAIQNCLMEAEFWNMWGVAAAGTETTARETQGIIAWAVYTGHARTAGDETLTIAGMDVPTAYASEYSDGGAATQLTRAILNTALENGWSRGFTVDGCMGFMGPTLKRRISDFANVYAGGGTNFATNERNVSADRRAVSETIDYFDTDMGTIGMNLNRYMTDTSLMGASPGNTVAYNPLSCGDQAVAPNETFIFMEPDKTKIRTLRGLEVQPLAKIGDSTKGQVIIECGIEACNPVSYVVGTGYTA